MRTTVVVSLIALLCITSLLADSSTSCKGKPNPYPPRDVAPKLQKTVPNGKLYIDDSVTPPLHILHVYGSDYEMGLAAGQLIKEKMQAFMDAVFQYLDDKVDSVLPPNAPQWLIDLIDQVGIPGALDLTYQWTLPYTPKHFEDELLGMADGAGVDVKKLRQLNMIPELIKAQCSMIGAWGDAIPNDGSTLFQMRALDWETAGPFADYAAVIIYHPNDGHNFAHLAWLGFVGALTGYSSANVGICEKLWDRYNGTYFVEGYPFHYLLRDILQFDPDTSGALNRIMNAHRTCSIFVGLGDSDTNQFRAVEYSHDYLNVWSDESFPVYEGHPQRKGLVYINKHDQPSNDPCFGDFLTENYGQVNAEMLIRAASLQQTGDNHAAVYDFKNNYMYVSSMSSSSDGQPAVGAFDRQFLRFDLNKMWAEPKP